MLSPLLKSFLFKELTTVFECSEEALQQVASKKILCMLGLYALGVLILFGLSVGLASVHSYFLMGVLGFLLWASIFVPCLLLGGLTFAVALYYGAYFARKGWER